jgi:hypothetical protein
MNFTQQNLHLDKHELIMDQLSKKEIRLKVEESASQTLEKLGITKPSKKTQKLIKQTSKKLTDALQKDLKKLYKKIKKEESILKVKAKAQEKDKKVAQPQKVVKVTKKVKAKSSLKQEPTN